MKLSILRVTSDGTTTAYDVKANETAEALANRLLGSPFSGDDSGPDYTSRIEIRLVKE